MPYGCLCGGCRDCLIAQGYDPDGETVEHMAEEIIGEWLADPALVGEYSAGLSEQDWERFERAIASCDDIEACRIYRAALREQMADDARQDARKRIRDERDQARQDAAEARAWAMEDY